MSNSSSSSSGVEIAVSVVIVVVASSLPSSLLMVAMISLSFGGNIHEGAADGSMVMVLVLSSAKRLFLLGGDDGEEDRNMVYV